MSKKTKAKQRKAVQAASARSRLSVAAISANLWTACRTGILSSNNASVMSVQAAIAAGADVNHLQSGASCLSIAAAHGHNEIVGFLITAGADIEAKLVLDFTALIVAAQCGHDKSVELLLAAGANKEAKIHTGCTALIMAAHYGHDKCIELLLNAGCDVNALNNEGFGALYIAVQKEHIDCVRTLVRCGADVTMQVQGFSLDDVADDTITADALKATLREPAEKRRRCNHCDTTTSRAMYKCGVCRTTYYCDRECQKADWQRHEPVCKSAVE
jgi:ankyrin repeat protein